MPVATSQRRLLGFECRGKLYHENCLSFGLHIAPFLFNLFAEAFHWALAALITQVFIAHYLDDLIFILPCEQFTIKQQVHFFYRTLVAALGLILSLRKDGEGATLEIIGVEIDTTTMTTRLPFHKLQKTISLVSDALTADKLPVHQAERITGFLSFCSAVVP